MTLSSLFQIAGLAATLSLAAAGAGALAAPTLADFGPDVVSGKETASAESEAPPILLAQGNCSSAASQVAADTGGQVLSVSSRDEGGRTVCVVTVLVPGKDGGRPRRTTVTVPG